MKSYREKLGLGLLSKRKRKKNYIYNFFYFLLNVWIKKKSEKGEEEYSEEKWESQSLDQSCKVIVGFYMEKVLSNPAKFSPFLSLLKYK